LHTIIGPFNFIDSYLGIGSGLKQALMMTTLENIGTLPESTFSSVFRPPHFLNSKYISLPLRFGFPQDHYKSTHPPPHVSNQGLYAPKNLKLKVKDPGIYGTVRCSDARALFECPRTFSGALYVSVIVGLLCTVLGGAFHHGEDID
jgi:hypothetical protein